MSLTADDRRLLAESLDRFLTTSYDSATYKALVKRQQAELGPNWPIYAELGWLGLAIPEEFGGSGAGDPGLAVLMEAVGKGLMLDPLLGVTVLGTGLIEELGGAVQCEALLRQICDGRLVPILAHSEPDLGFARAIARTTASDNGDLIRIDGAKAAVHDAPLASHLLVSARGTHGRSAFS